MGCACDTMQEGELGGVGSQIVVFFSLSQNNPVHLDWNILWEHLDFSGVFLREFPGGPPASFPAISSVKGFWGVFAEPELRGTEMWDLLGLNNVISTCV